MDKYIAFDIGRVLVNIDLDPFIKVYRELSLDLIDDPMAFLLDLHGQQDVGLTTIGRAAKERFGINTVAIEALLDAWNKIIIPEPSMIKLLDELRKDEWRVALLSNIGHEHVEYIKKEFSYIFSGCDLHLSCEVGSRKPGKLFYQSFLIDHNDYRGCLYIDDLEENLEMGKYYGFKSYEYNLERDGIKYLDDLKREIYIDYPDLTGGAGI